MATGNGQIVNASLANGSEPTGQLHGGSNGAAPRETTALPPRPLSDGDTLSSGAEQFFGFLKQYTALFAGVASLPLLSSFLDILPPPSLANLKLNLLASVLCFVAFSASFAARGTVASALLSRTFWRLAPLFVSIVLLFASVVTTAFYLSSWVQPPHGRTAPSPDGETPSLSTTAQKPDASPGPGARLPSASIPPPGASVGPAATVVNVTQYFAIHTLFVLALGILLVTLFTQERGPSIQNLIEARLRSRIKELRTFVRNYADFVSLADQNETLKEIGEGFIAQRNAELAALSQGTVEVVGRDLPLVQGQLLEHCKVRFDAVSDRDLGFWLGKRDSYIADEYFRQNIEAIDRGKIVTRIFVITEDDLRHRGEDLRRVLEKHTDASIGWAVAIWSELGPLEPDAALDFATFDDTVAVSYFRDYREGARKFRAVFGTNDPNLREIERQKHQYTNVLTHCWLASGLFLEQRRDMIASVSVDIRRIAENVRRRAERYSKLPTPGDVFLLEATREQSLTEPFGQLLTLFESCQKWRRMDPQAMTRDAVSSDRGNADTRSTSQPA
jgi:hypothetical protein